MKKRKRKKQKKNGNNDIFLIMLETIIFFTFVFLTCIIIVKKNSLYHEKQNYLYKRITLNLDEPYIFEGNAINNYVLFNNLTWRIVRVNTNGSIMLVLNNTLNYLPQIINNEFNLLDYLNNDFLKELDIDKLDKNNICSDIIDNTETIKCNNLDGNYISLIDVSSFRKSIITNNYISSNNDILWLINKYDDNNYWHTDGNKIGYNKNTNFYGVKPVITLKNNILYESGEGTIDNPYVINNNKMTIGSKVIIDQDEYTVINTDNNIRLILNKTINLKVNYSKLLDELNSKYYNSLNYKDVLVDNDCKEIIINNSIIDNISTRKVCTINALDFIINSYNDYYLLTKYNNYNLVVNNNMITYGTKKNTHNVIPTITIDKDSNFKYVDGKYILER